MFPRHLILCLAGLPLAVGSIGPVRAADRVDSVYLSEFMAEGPASPPDEDGDHPGWIELRNGAADPVSLQGWFLSDTPTHLVKWRFPRVSLLPDMGLVVFASGKARATNLARLHTSFRLDPRGNYLALVNPSTNIVSELVCTNPPPGASYGRLRGEPSVRAFFLQPTPGRPNAVQGTGFASRVVFSRPSGAFTAPFTLQLSNDSPQAIIRFTVDGSLPTAASPVFARPLLITNSVHLRARAYQDGLLAGPPRSETYLLLDAKLTDFTSNLPILVMDTLGSEQAVLTRSSWVHLTMFEPVNGRTSLTNPPTLSSRGGFHVRGSSSSGLPQSPYAVQCLDEFNREQSRPLLGLPADSDWVLYAPTGYEPVMIHNPFIHQLARDLGHYSPRTRFVEVYLVRDPGPVTARHYHGVYVLEEKIKVGPHRVAIDRLGPDDLRAPAVTGGYLLKVDRQGPGESGFYAAGASLVYVDPKEAVIDLPQRAPQKHYLSAYFDDFERALNGSNWQDPIRGYRAYVDVDSWIDYHVLEVLSGNVDTLVLSTYFYKPRNGRLHYGPHWDFDRALGSTDGRDDNPRQWNTGPFFGAPWWSRLCGDVDFWQQWVDRWQELRRTQFSLANLHGLIDRLTDELREAQPRQAKRWDLQPRGGSYQSEIDLMKSWLSNRVDFIDGQLVQPPWFSQPGGPVAAGFPFTLAGPANARVYYTLDGSDPRLSQGSISSNALLYAGPVPLHSNVWVTARAYNPDQRQSGGPPSSTPWSGPVAAKFVVSPTQR